MHNFGKIKNAFNTILVESIIKKDKSKREIFKKYVKTIKKSDILKTQFSIYNNIENRIDENFSSANVYISENIKFLGKFKKADIKKENEKLFKISEEISKVIDQDYQHSKLHESIDKLIFTSLTPKNIDIISEETNKVIDFIKTNKKKEINETLNIPNSLLATLTVDKYNEKYADLDETDKKILKAILDSNSDGKKEIYESTIKECIELVNKQLVESDLELKEKLLNVKDKLINDKNNFNENEFINNVSKLIELKKDLNK